MFSRYKFNLAPPFFEDDEDKTRLAGLIHSILMAITASSVAYTIVWPILEPDLLWRVVFILPVYPLIILIRALNQRGNVQGASFILVSGIWLIMLVAAVSSGGVRSAAFAGNILVILFAQILLGQRTALRFAVISILLGVVMVYAEGAGFIPHPDLYTTPASMWIAQSIYFVVAIVMLNLATYTIRDALARAKNEIGERKHTEEALREAEVRYRTLVEQMPVVTYRDAPDPDASALYVSPQIEQLIGYSPQEWTADPYFWQSLLHPDERELVLADVEDYLNQKSSSVIEYRLQSRDGNWIWVRDEAVIVKDEYGNPLFVQGTLSNITDRKQVEEALRASEEKFNKAFYFSPFPMSISGPSRGYIEVNEAFMALLGRSRKEIVGQHARDIGFWADPEEQAEAIEILFREGWLRDFEFHFRKKSGEIGIGLSSAALITINEEQCALASVFDLTYRKQAEEALRASEEKFQKAFQASPVAMVISHPEKGIMDVNENFIITTGFTREDLLGKSSLNVGFWVDTKEQEDMAEILEIEGAVQNTEFQFQRKTGEIRQAIGSAVIVEIEGKLCSLASIFDITDRKTAEEALRKSEEKFQKAFQSSPVSMTINSPTKGILNVNRAFEELTGFERAEVLGRHAVEVGLWVNLDERQHSIEEVRQKGSLHDFEFQFRKRDGEIRVGMLAVDLIEIEEEKCYLASFQDITSRKHSEEALRNINVELEARVQSRTAQLEAANQELESFSYSVSHDLRAPLRAINSFSRILIDEYPDHLPAEAKRFLHLAQENALKMARLIDNLLEFSRLGRSLLKIRPVEPEALAQEVWDDLAHERENRSIAFMIRGLTRCQADPNLLRQVFANLLSNAIKFTRQREQAHIEIGNELLNGENVYYVKDNGAGFDMEYADKLFGVFQRLHHETEFEGTGVGLATVQRIIHRHGGRIWAEAEPDKGATFYFTLSAAPPGI